MRIDYRTALPAALKRMHAIEQAVRQSTVEPALLELVKTRASQLNGCAHCVDMHTKDARSHVAASRRGVGDEPKCTEDPMAVASLW